MQPRSDFHTSIQLPMPRMYAHTAPRRGAVLDTEGVRELVAQELQAPAVIKPRGAGTILSVRLGSQAACRCRAVALRVVRPTGDVIPTTAGHEEIQRRDRERRELRCVELNQAAVSARSRHAPPL